jgi:malic enzyme
MALTKNTIRGILIVMLAGLSLAMFHIGQTIPVHNVLYGAASGSAAIAVIKLLWDVYKS